MRVQDPLRALNPRGPLRIMGAQAPLRAMKDWGALRAVDGVLASHSCEGPVPGPSHKGELGNSVGDIDGGMVLLPLVRDRPVVKGRLPEGGGASWYFGVFFLPCT